MHSNVHNMKIDVTEGKFRPSHNGESSKNCLSTR